MKITLAKTSGFCMGVKRAMQIALDTAQKSGKKPVYTCGPLIHNPQAVEYLREHGVEITNDYRLLKEGFVIIRAHGMPKSVIDEMKKTQLCVVDATCPHVLTSQRKIKKYSEEGYFIYIVGDRAHPEILSLQSFASKYRLIADFNEALAEEPPDKIMVIAQTTYNAKEFAKIAEHLKQRAKEAVICDSICLATFDRQEEVRLLASESDAVIVVGGKSSANTRRLAQIAGSLCAKAWHVETVDELMAVDFSGIEKLAVSAGASTPDFITDQIIEFLKTKSL